jgi:6-O-methylguanine DNA methyltransferase-like protein
MQRALDGIVALLRGEPSDLTAVALDMGRVPAFHRRVYEVARTIPSGATFTCGEIATRLGAPGEARAVGQALGTSLWGLFISALGFTPLWGLCISTLASKRALSTAPVPFTLISSLAFSLFRSHHLTNAPVCFIRQVPSHI